MIKNKSIHEVLTKISEELTEKIKYPNDGGCCVIASVVGKHLSKHVPVALRIIDYKDTSLNDIVKNTPKDAHAERVMDHFCSNNVIFNHVVIQAKLEGKNVYWDSNGTTNSLVNKKNSYTKVRKGTIPLEIGSKLAESTNWNEEFNRKQIPKIEKIVAKHFKKLDKVVM